MMRMKVERGAHRARCRRGIALLWGALVGLLLTPTAAPAAPKIEQWRTDNGARVLFVRAPQIPLVDARITFDAGSARDGDAPGIARLVSDLLMSGTQQRDADAIARALERHGAQVSTGSERDMAWIDLRSLADDAHLAPVADTVGAIVAEPAFPDSEITRLKRQQRTALDEQAQSPGQIAQQRFWSEVYDGHPYGHDPLGTRDSLGAIEQSDLRAFHSRYYVAANANVAIVGSIERQRAESLAETLVGGLPRGKPATSLPEPPTVESERTIRVSFPSSQAHVVMGRPAVARGYARWPAFYVANHVLGGGGFTSRLFSEVREKRGLVYSISSRASPMAAAGPFLVRFQTRGDRSERALAIVNDQFDRFWADGITDAELNDAQRKIGGSFPLEIDSNDELAGYLSMMGFYGMPVDYLERFPEAIAEVTPERALRSFRNGLGSQALVTVVVGGDRSDGRGETDE